MGGKERLSTYSDVIFNCGMRSKAEVLMLVEGLHGQFKRNSVCL